MNPPEPQPAPSEPSRRRKTMDQIRKVGLKSLLSQTTETELPPVRVEAAQPPETLEAAQPPASEKPPASEVSPKPLRVARSPHPLDNFSFDQLCPEDDDPMARTISPEEAKAAALGKSENTVLEAVEETAAEKKQGLPKGPFKGPTNKVAAPPRARKVERYVPKTMLDHNLILQNLSVSVAKSNEKLAQKVAEKEAAPPKPCIPIENYKMAQKACPFTWGEMDAPKERFRYCDKCETPVYNFTGMDLPEAEELIFKREERRNAPLFKRADGKFMTKDCPVALKKKYGMAMMIGGGILVLAILAGLAMLMPPPPPQPKPAEAPPIEVNPEVQTMPPQPQPSATPPLTPPVQESPSPPVQEQTPIPMPDANSPSNPGA